MRDKFFYITLLVFITTLSITGALYYKLSQKTIIEYDNELVPTRNLVINQIDNLTSTLNNSEEVEEIQEQITILESNNNNLKTKIESTSTPSNKGEQIKTLNQDFTRKVEEIIQASELYKQSFEDDTIDPIEAMNTYNQKVTELNTKIQEITEFLQENQNENLLGI